MLEAEKFGIYELMKKFKTEAIDAVDNLDDAQKMYENEKMAKNSLNKALLDKDIVKRKSDLIFNQTIISEKHSRDNLLEQHIEVKHQLESVK